MKPRRTEAPNLAKSTPAPAGVVETRTRARRAAKDDVIQLRVATADKDLLLKAAAIRGQSLSEYVMTVARDHAVDTVLDQKVFKLDPDSFDALLDMLDNPPPLEPTAIERLTRKPLWEK